MRAPLISLLISAAGLVAGGCASSPPQKEPPVTLNDQGCSGEASNPLHLTTIKTVAERGDPEIDSILTQHAEPRLVWVNRQMYLSLHALDVELRREQRVAECERSQTLEAQASGGPNGSVGAGSSRTDTGAGAATGSASATGRGALMLAGSGGAASGGGAAAPASGSSGAPAGGTSDHAVTLASADVTTTGAAAPASANGAAVTAMSAAPARLALTRKSSLSSAGGGGNGATMPKVVTGSDNDIVARRLRKAAEQETDPVLQKKLWKEYADYRQGIAAK